MTAVLIDPKLCCGHRLPVRDLSQVEAELLVVSPLVRKIFIFLHWKRKKNFYGEIHFCWEEMPIEKYEFTSWTAAYAAHRRKYASINAQGKKCNLSHLLSHSRSNPNILTTNKSTFHFIKSVNSIQVAVPRQALYCVPNCILRPWWMGCQLRKTGWFQLKTLSSAPQVRKKTRQDSSASYECPLWPHFWPHADLC